MGVLPAVSAQPWAAAGRAATTAATAAAAPGVAAAPAVDVVQALRTAGVDPHQGVGDRWAGGGGGGGGATRMRAGPSALAYRARAGGGPTSLRKLCQAALLRGYLLLRHSRDVLVPPAPRVYARSASTYARALRDTRRAGAWVSVLHDSREVLGPLRPVGPAHNALPWPLGLRRGSCARASRFLHTTIQHWCALSSGRSSPARQHPSRPAAPSSDDCPEVHLVLRSPQARPHSNSVCSSPCQIHDADLWNEMAVACPVKAHSLLPI